MDNYTIFFLIFIGSIFLSRVMLNNAYKKLPSEEKVRLVELFSTNKTYTYIGLFAMVIIYVLVLKFKLFDFKIITNLYFIILIMYLIVKSYFSYNKLKETNSSEAYIKSYLLSTAVTLAGFLVLLLSINFLK